MPCEASFYALKGANKILQEAAHPQPLSVLKEQHDREVLRADANRPPGQPSRALSSRFVTTLWICSRRQYLGSASVPGHSTVACRGYQSLAYI